MDKMIKSGNLKSNVTTELSDVFLELLEGQFPITDGNRPIDLRFPSDFANRLNIHVNHLNRANKKKLRKTTTQLINEHCLKEAKRLLASTEWKIIKIALALGFKESAHFSNFFKRQTGVGPAQYKNTQRGR